VNLSNGFQRETQRETDLCITLQQHRIPNAPPIESLACELAVFGTPLESDNESLGIGSGQPLEKLSPVGTDLDSCDGLRPVNDVSRVLEAFDVSRLKLQISRIEQTE
jgi:hypothetical protein